MPKRKLAKQPIAEAAASNGTPQLSKAAVNGTTPSKKRKIEVIELEDSSDENLDLKPSKKQKKSKTTPKKKHTTKTVQDEKDDEEDSIPRPSKSRKSSKKTISKHEEISQDEATETIETKPKPKRKTKEEKAADAMPLAIRTAGHKLFVGAHVSSAGGVHNAIANSVRIGGNAFALFLKSQRKWANPALAEDVASAFHVNCNEQGYDQASHSVPHGSYLVNLAHVDAERTKQAYDSFLDDLKRCERLGIRLYNFHPGVANSTNGDRGAAIAHLASNLNRAHKATKKVVTLLENMAAGGNVLGSTFEDLRDIIALVHDKKRVGVCIDTCHAFAGGYDLRTPSAFKATMDEFEDVVGFQYLRALHINDSKAPLASHKDLHANIGTGFLGLRSFHNLVNDSRFHGLPLILETPCESENTWATEIKLLESLVGMDVDSEKFSKLEKELAAKGETERKRVNEVVERKKEKDAKKGTKGKKKKAKKEESEDEEDSDVD